MGWFTLSLAAALLALAAMAAASKAHDRVASNFYDLSANRITGQLLSFSSFRDQVVLVANVASECGFTEQGYSELTKLQTMFGPRGFQVLAFPCNQFGAQEPGPASEIEEFARLKKANFIMLEKIDVNGPLAHPVYKFLTQGSHEIKWNFEYFLISKNGQVAQHYPAGTKLNTPEVHRMISQLLMEDRGVGGGHDAETHRRDIDRQRDRAKNREL